MLPTGIALFLLIVDKGGEGGYSGTHEMGVWLDAGVWEPLRKEERDVDEALLAVRPPIEGRFLFSCSEARRMALPCVRLPKFSISVRTGLKMSSKSWTIWSMSGGGDGNPSSSQ